jgi:hypothetical protein
MILNISEKNEYDICRWCIAHISPCKYWLHNRRGSKEWEIYASGGKTFLNIKNEEQAIIAVLKFGVKHENKI